MSFYFTLFLQASHIYFLLRKVLTSFCFCFSLIYPSDLPKYLLLTSDYVHIKHSLRVDVRIGVLLIFTTHSWHDLCPYHLVCLCKTVPPSCLWRMPGGQFPMHGRRRTAAVLALVHSLWVPQQHQQCLTCPHVALWHLENKSETEWLSWKGHYWSSSSNPPDVDQDTFH